jgi:hypothetical protein
VEGTTTVAVHKLDRRLRREAPKEGHKKFRDHLFIQSFVAVSQPPSAVERVCRSGPEHVTGLFDIVNAG